MTDDKAQFSNPFVLERHPSFEDRVPIERLLGPIRWIVSKQSISEYSRLLIGAQIREDESFSAGRGETMPPKKKEQPKQVPKVAVDKTFGLKNVSFTIYLLCTAPDE
jgi:hypothetical protein